MVLAKTVLAAVALAMVALGAVLLLLAGPWFTGSAVAAAVTPAAVNGGNATSTGTPAMSSVDALVLGVVEGVTEFLPISSTGHLLVTGRLLGLDGNDVADPVAAEAAKDAFDSYAIAIQAGAILAVLALYWRRVLSILQGLVGRDPDGRTLALNLLVAFVPAALIGLVAEGSIKARLFQPWAIALAWAVGGLAILIVERRRATVGSDRPGSDRVGAGGLSLEHLRWRPALIIGVAQAFAMWPGTSRSLVTILAGMAVGLSVAAAVELSFLLGLLTLGAATAYEGLSNGSVMVDAYGVGRPLLGLLAALVSAFLAVRWMVGWLQSRGLEVFGWYRLGAAGVLVALLAVGSV
ncbi:MAG: undecaprenyl-diphosphate phosphatase [Acidimicrobiales bacterium]